ncbi:hypothetical protein [Spirochaeta dissipatitropha]
MIKGKVFLIFCFFVSFSVFSEHVIVDINTELYELSGYTHRDSHKISILVADFDNKFYNMFSKTYDSNIYEMKLTFEKRTNEQFYGNNFYIGTLDINNKNNNDVMEMIVFTYRIFDNNIEMNFRAHSLFENMKLVDRELFNVTHTYNIYKTDFYEDEKVVGNFLFIGDVMFHIKNILKIKDVFV